ncbi:unnamed protein product, partial [Cuscuta europaea]
MFGRLTGTIVFVGNSVILFTWGKLLYHQQERTTAATRVIVEDLEASWSIVRHKRRRSIPNQAHILNQLTTKLYRDKDRLEGNTNHFFFLDMEDFPPSSTLHSQESKTERQNHHNRLYYSHGARDNVWHTGKARGRASQI